MATLAEFPAYRRLALRPESADGCRLRPASGKEVLDLYGGHCVNTLGAGDPELGAALAAQWRQLSFVTNLLEHGPRAAFLESFAAILPHGGWQVFCSNSGAEANENALKMALLATRRRRIVCFEGAFHGRTAAAAAVSDADSTPFPAAPFEVQRLPFGSCDGIDERCAAVILEPIQSLAGVIVPPPGFLEALREACHRSGALLIFDEVQTGVGRLGSFWASQHFGVRPDLFTAAKGVASGLPIGITLVREEIAGRVPPGALGSTFGGGPLVLAAAAKVAQRLAAPGFLEGVRAASRVLQGAASVGPVRSVRGSGLLLGLVVRAPLTATQVRDALLAGGILTGTSRDAQVLRLTPPLTLQEHEARRLLEALADLEVTA